MRTNESPYDARFYADRKRYASEFDAMGRVLGEVFCPRTVLDLGCGPGEILRSLRDRFGCSVLGVDGSEHAKHAAGDIPVLVRDLTDCDLHVPSADLVLCLETAEHIPESGADALVETVARNVSRWLVWSSATPGQGGTDHVNEQPQEYWWDKLDEAGLCMRPQLTNAIQMLFATAAPTQPWYGRTTMVFERV